MDPDDDDVPKKKLELECINANYFHQNHHEKTIEKVIPTFLQCIVFIHCSSQSKTTFLQGVQSRQAGSKKANDIHINLIFRHSFSKASAIKVKSDYDINSLRESELPTKNKNDIKYYFKNLFLT